MSSEPGNIASTWTNATLLKIGGSNISCRVWHKLKGMKMTGSLKRNLEDDLAEVVDCKRMKRDEDGTGAAAPKEQVIGTYNYRL